MLSPQQSTSPEDKFQRINKIGQGTYGVVYKARDKETNQIVAIKKIRLDHEDEGIPSTAVREISLLKILKHPNIINLKEVITGDKKLSLVFEYCDCDLKKFLQHNTLTEQQVKQIIYQLLLSLQFCHANRVIHRDLKPQNILIDQKNQINIKLADFGLARTYFYPMKQYTHEIITLWYRAPEVLLGTEVYYPTVDTWSVGCIMYEIAHKRILFCGDSQIDQIFKIFQVMGTPSENLWKDVTKLKDFKPTFPKWRGGELDSMCNKLSKDGIDILKKMLIYDPVERISTQHALNHPFFDSVDKSKFADRDY